MNKDLVTLIGYGFLFLAIVFGGAFYFGGIQGILFATGWLAVCVVIGLVSPMFDKFLERRSSRKKQ